MPVSRFAALAGIPERTYRYRLARLRSGAMRGPWPAPAVDAIEELAAKYAESWPAWGHRKIAALLRADGHAVSTSTVERALRRRNLLLRKGFRADRKSWAMLRRRVFRDPPTERNRVWQMDFSEFETPAGGIWRICAVIDYVTKYCFAATLTATCRGRDAADCLSAAVAEATRLLDLDDLRADRGSLDLIDETTGELIATVPAPIAVVTDNGSAFKSSVFAELFTGDDPLLRHVRTRVRSPQTNGVIERFFETLKYKHLYRGHIDDADALAVEINLFRHVYNQIRPHQTLGDATPHTAYLHLAHPGLGAHLGTCE
jgi:putative transposase